MHSNDLLTIDSKVSKRLPLRIPPRTSTCFQYIYTPRNDIEKFDVAANDISIFKPLIISGNEPSGEEPIQEKRMDKNMLEARDMMKIKRRMKTCTRVMTKK